MGPSCRIEKAAASSGIPNLWMCDGSAEKCIDTVLGENVYSYHGIFKLYFDIIACLLVRCPSSNILKSAC